jgi:hypothetical protein
MTPLDPSLLESAKSARERLVDAQHEADGARADYQHAIRKLHAGGGSMREIAEALGLSHQRVHQIVDDKDAEAEHGGPPFNIPWFGRGRKQGGRGPFARFRSPARAAIVHAQDEAHDLDHEYIGTEHILLGVLRAEDGVAAQVLSSLGITLDDTRERIVAIVGRGPGESAGSGRAPFTPRAKKALELALRESLALDHDYIGTEHLLLGLVREGEGVAAQVLEQQGADAETVRAAVKRALGT